MCVRQHRVLRLLPFGSILLLGWPSSRLIPRSGVFRRMTLARSSVFVLWLLIRRRQWCLAAGVGAVVVRPTAAPHENTDEKDDQNHQHPIRDN
jgi:hypothetical protein